MADVKSFHAVHYNLEKVGELGKVVTQPYDKISPAMQARYYEASPYNLVRIIKGKENPGDGSGTNIYSRAVADLSHWLAEGVLVSDNDAAIYPYYQEYNVPGAADEKRQRRGFIALLKLEDYEARVVHRHEETLSGPKVDRMELLKATRTHFGQVFMLYSDPAGTVETLIHHQTIGEPWECLIDEYECEHKAWRVRDPEIVNQIVEGMKDKKLIIADGHHRYETALAYRNYCRENRIGNGQAEYVMATFVRMESPGLTILPTHRVVHGVPNFDWDKFAGSAHRLFSWEKFRAQGPSKQWAHRLMTCLAKAGAETHSLGVYAGKGRVAILRLRGESAAGSYLSDVAEALRKLDVVILHRLVLEGLLGITREAVREEKNLSYLREAEAALREVDSGRAQICFLMNATPIGGVGENALDGHTLPQKSTDFYPKLLSGLTGYWLDNPQGI
jgi:uncharacterized protein (DUF1015 family)